MNYEIGDKVKFIGKNRMYGRKGNIIEDGGRNWYRVKFESNRSMWCLEYELEPLAKNETIERAKPKPRTTKPNKDKYNLRLLEVKTGNAFCSISLEDENKCVFSSTHTSCEKCFEDLKEWLEK